jgi:uncharacterized membrane protein YfcA
MFYVIIAVFIIGCLSICALSKIRRKALFTSCPCVAVGSILAAAILYYNHNNLAASIVLAVGLYLTILILGAVRRQTRLEKENA